MYTRIDYSTIVPEDDDGYGVALGRDLANLLADRASDEETSYDLYTRLDVQFEFNTICEEIGHLPVKCNILVTICETKENSFFYNTDTAFKVFATIYITDKPYGNELDIDIKAMDYMRNKGNCLKSACLDMGSAILSFMRYCETWSY